MPVGVAEAIHAVPGEGHDVPSGRSAVGVNRWQPYRTAHLGLGPTFPGGGIAYAKTEEKMPYMTWDEAERRIAAGDDPDSVWECIYLRPSETAEILAWDKDRPVSPWIFPMLCFAAHTGARRSEVVRALASDLDLEGRIVTIREKKRDQRKLTTRQVPLSPFLIEVLREWVQTRAAGKALFCKDSKLAVTPREAQNYFRWAFRLSKWHVLKGWHVFRHSLISALASQGTDQLYPDVRHKAIANAFGDGAISGPGEGPLSGNAKAPSQK